MDQRKEILEVIRSNESVGIIKINKSKGIEIPVIIKILKQLLLCGVLTSEHLNCKNGDGAGMSTEYCNSLLLWTDCFKQPSPQLTLYVFI